MSEPSTIPFRVEIVRSARRRKSVAARLVGDVVRVTVPASMPQSEQDRHVRQLVDRLVRRHRSDAVDVEARARQLARAYGLPQPASVRWVTNQSSRWGSCSPNRGDIRMSDRLAAFPPWVLDFVLLHELAHLVHANHGPAFQALLDRYPRAERARGYLIAKGVEPDE